MALHRFDLAGLAATPWKNGGGVTREIVCRPPGAGIEGFDWRVSIAAIDRPGPFSAFPGVERTIVLLAGAGVRLHSRDGAIDHRLDLPLQPFAFAGEPALDCDLLGGGCTDFNLMSRRDRVRAGLRVLRQGAQIAAAGAGLLLALGGRWRLRAAHHGETTVCAPESGLWWDAAAHGWQAEPQDPGAALIAVRIEPALTSSGA
jgi:environmental stress-induced protein Ves